MYVSYSLKNDSYNRWVNGIYLLITLQSLRDITMALLISTNLLIIVNTVNTRLNH